MLKLSAGPQSLLTMTFVLGSEVQGPSSGPGLFQYDMTSFTEDPVHDWVLL